jgi:hypothetical protein
MTDPLLFSRDPALVTLAGRDFLLPYRPAAGWIGPSQRMAALVPLMAEREDRDAMVDLLMDHPGARADIISEGRRILSQATGRRWYEAQKLINTSVQPEALGRLILAGVHPWERSIGEWCAALYALYVKGADQKTRSKLDFSLALPPPGAEDEWDDEGADPEATMAAVQAMMNQ